jgi:hypothetical protein
MLNYTLRRLATVLIGLCIVTPLIVFYANERTAHGSTFEFLSQGTF